MFRVLWDTIKLGKPIGAYVKNRTKDGRFYWVFAIVTPIEGGFLSIRIRPSSAILPTVKSLYAKISAAERQEKLQPAESLNLLLNELEGLGFNDYASFMATALGKEAAARNAQLKRPGNTEIAEFEALISGSQSLLTNAEIITRAYKVNENVPLNFSVLASKLGQEGATINVISSNYRLLSAQMKEILDKFVQAAREVNATVNNGFFLFLAAHVQDEILKFFANESAEDQTDRQRDMRLLRNQQTQYCHLAWQGLRNIDHKIASFAAACVDMGKLVTGLEVTRIMGKMESSTHSAAKIRLEELLEDLAKFQSCIAEALRSIENTNKVLKAETSKLIVAAERMYQSCMTRAA